MIPVCPRCDTALFILEFKGIEVDFCHQCRGLWFDAGELELLLERTGATGQERLRDFDRFEARPLARRKMLCPRCDNTLCEFDVKGEGDAMVSLDRCPQGHGLWFDQRELRQLLAMAPPGSGAEKTIEFLNDLLGKEDKRTT
jgi:Zn-finger nucleic acid-binding protein